MPDQSPYNAAPLLLFKSWIEKAIQTELEDPDAACVATVDETGMPNARMVLIRKYDERGFVFFTNYNSQKGKELFANPKAAICFHWKSLQRQVRIQGLVEKTSSEEADEYFNSRQRSSRIASIASLQSSPLPNRETLEARIQKYEQEFSGIESPPRPAHWSGFRIVPQRIEFWQQKEFRTHERIVYIRDGENWHTEMLYP